MENAPLPSRADGARVLRHKTNARRSHTRVRYTMVDSPQVREVTAQYTHKDFRWKAEALLALQEMAEAYLVALFEDA